MLIELKESSSKTPDVNLNKHTIVIGEILNLETEISREVNNFGTPHIEEKISNSMKSKSQAFSNPRLGALGLKIFSSQVIHEKDEKIQNINPPKRLSSGLKFGFEMNLMLNQHASTDLRISNCDNRMFKP